MLFFCGLSLAFCPACRLYSCLQPVVFLVVFLSIMFVHEKAQQKHATRSYIPLIIRAIPCKSFDKGKQRVFYKPYEAIA